MNRFPFKVDMMFDVNRAKHHTDQYRGIKDDEVTSCDRLIVRRADSFSLKVSPSTPLPPDAVLDFRMTPYDPIYDKPLKFDAIEAPFSNESNCTTYCTWQDNPSSSIYNVFMPVNTPVALYAIEIAVHSGGKDQFYMMPTRLIVLFNPWSPIDEVYLSDPNDIAEYVVNEDGCSWVGSEDEMSPVPWDHAQFSQAPLDVALWSLQDLPGGSFEDRADSIKVGRHLSSRMNVNDNNGVLWGRWQEPYTGGKPPTYWQGSLEIFQQYRKKQEGVKYGQCWVFAGILTTAGRTLGIPARTVTNFASAHEEGKADGKYDLRIDTYFEPNGTYLGMEGSIWNFHQWTEYFMNRTDLTGNASKGGYSGWQTVDATPQEVSAESGLYQLGPASVPGIKARQDQNFDTLFVISEVDAGLYKWIRKNTGKQPSPKYKGFYLLEVDDEAIGLKMSTKHRGTMKREDVTAQYKVMDPTLLEHERGMNRIATLHHDEVSLKIVPPTKGLFVGKDIDIAINAICHVCNSTSHRRLVITSVISSVSYIGHTVKQLMSDSRNLTLMDSTPTSSVVTLHVEDYESAMGDGQGIQYSTTAMIFSETAPGVWNDTTVILNKFGQFSMVVLPPKLASTAVNASAFTLLVSYDNPMAIPLTGVLVRISGSSINNVDIPLSDIVADGNVDLSQVITLRQFAGKLVVVSVKVLANELSNINGYISVNMP